MEGRKLILVAVPDYAGPPSMPSQTRVPRPRVGEGGLDNAGAGSNLLGWTTRRPGAAIPLGRGEASMSSSNRTVLVEADT